METKFNFKSQICTDKNQSERLLALGLKKETADCGIYYSELAGCDRMFAKIETEFEADEIPAWSLHRLIEMRLDEDYSCGFNLNQGEDAFEKVIRHIEHHIKEGYFNKQYLEE